jgi:hypothetical protein
MQYASQLDSEGLCKPCLHSLGEPQSSYSAGLRRAFSEWGNGADLGHNGDGSQRDDRDETQ